jgi:uncharacterized protein (DUF488 family)
MTILTVGHSTHPLSAFIALLKAHTIKHLVDIRTVPRSRHNSQFNRETLPQQLQEAGIAYSHMAVLGGLRKTRKDSPNTAWRNESFRGYADYMQTDEFEKGLRELIELASHEKVAIMCAEAVPWRCHRFLVADALTAHGVTVEHIMNLHHRDTHSLSKWAQIRGQKVLYPKGEEDLQARLL